MILLQAKGINAANSRLSGGGGGVTLAEDDFNRANGTMDSAPGNAMSDGSNTWALGLNDGWSINTNEAVSDSAAANVQYCDSMADTADVLVEAKLGSSINGKTGIVARFTVADGYRYQAYRKLADQKGYVERIDVGGTTAVVNSGATTYAAGDVIGLKCVGATIHICKGGTSVGSAVDAGGRTTGKAGLYAESNGMKVDDWSAQTV